MRVMPANCSGMLVGYLAGRFPGQLGHLFSPDAQRGPWPWMPYALDNGAFPAFTRKRPWDPEPWWELLDWAKTSKQDPLWVLVPDMVGDAMGTIAMWHKWAPEAADYGWPLAFAAQDGMEPRDVPKEADVVFIGGSTEWKRAAIVPWCAYFPRVHVGRINTGTWLWHCQAAGAESVDGTGWFRGGPKSTQTLELVQWLESQKLSSCGVSDVATVLGSSSYATDALVLRGAKS